MSNTKHTPGKWEVHKNIKHSHAIGTYDSGSFNPVAYLHTKQDDLEYEANAKLISAAPELLRALYSLRLSVMAHPDYTGEDNAEWTDLIETADEAIKKATT